ncbi:MAG: hypothetical protein ABW352_03435 [Polyangiales bacterium]
MSRKFGIGVGAAKLTILVAMGCADEGITHIAGPYPVKTADAGKPPKVDAGRKPVEEDPDDQSGEQTDDEPPPEQEEPVDAGTKKDARAPVVDAGKTEEEEPTEEELPPCPSGYSCMDPAGPLMAMGLSGMITDPDGNAVEFSCAKGGQETCDPKDPKKSCPNFSDPYCAHVKLSGLLAVELDQCAQKCTP